LDMTEADWDHVLDVNLKGSFFCAQAAARAMIAGRRPGSIMNLASMAIRGAVRGTHYSASKGGVVAMTRAMALELAPHGIRGNANAPGPARPPPAAPGHPRGGVRRHAGRRPARAHAPPRGHRRRGRLPGLPPGAAHHGPDAARQRRAVPAVAPWTDGSRARRS